MRFYQTLFIFLGGVVLVFVCGSGCWGSNSGPDDICQTIIYKINIKDIFIYIKDIYKIRNLSLTHTPLAILQFWGLN
jgi:hypothetical protein